MKDCKEERIVIMNSANMFNDGEYCKKTISKNQFIYLIKNAKTIKSSVGYQLVSDIIKELTDIDVPVSRDSTNVDDSYTIIGLTLPYRVSTKSKGRNNVITPDDYVYFKCTYKVS